MVLHFIVGEPRSLKKLFVSSGARRVVKATPLTQVARCEKSIAQLRCHAVVYGGTIVNLLDLPWLLVTGGNLG